MTLVKTDKKCNTRIHIPVWLIILDNMPTFIMFVLGMHIVYSFNWLLGISYILYAIFSIIWFWARICTHCHFYAKQGCPCGYGVISAKFFSPREKDNFKKVFKTNIAVLFPCWFIPPILGIILLITGFSIIILIELLIFAFIAFAIIPLLSRFGGCKNCSNKDECPWMN